jgi:hypothetical protein
MWLVYIVEYVPVIGLVVTIIGVIVAIITIVVK